MLEAARPAAPSPSLKRQKLALWLSFILIAVVGLLAFVATQQLIATSRRVEETQRLLIEAHRFLSELTEVESAARGYLLSGDQRFVVAHRRASDTVEVMAQRLLRLRPRSPAGERVARLVDLAERRIALTRTAMSEFRPSGTAPAAVLSGAEVMERLRRSASAVSSMEMRRYEREHILVERQALLASVALGLAIAVSIIVLAGLFRIRGNEIKRRRELEDELRTLNLQLEDRVQERTAEVKRARDMLDAVVENLPDMVVVKKPSGDCFRYALVNRAGEKLIGRPRSEIIGKTEHDLFPADEVESIIKANKAVAESRKARSFRERKLTGTEGARTVETRIVPIANGGTPWILAIVRDVTEAKSREEQLRMLQRMDAVGRLTGGVAHDFNNLLAIIHGNSELLLSRFDNEPDAKAMLDDVIGAAARGAELVKRLLAFARIQHLEPEAVDLNVRLPGIVRMLERVLGERVTVRLKLAEDLWSAIVDPTQVDDALVNLAINARDAMPHGGTLTVETANVRLDEDYAAQHVEVVPGEYVMLAVSDSGIGMPPEVVERAFEPFFTTKPEGQGTGLGLSQVFGWVKQSGGHVKIYSELGHGTTLKLYLPRAREGSGIEKEEREVATPTGNETIFVVEDNPKVRRTVVRQLHDLGYATIEAESGADALDLVRRGKRFDLLLTDVVMPGGMTGYDLAAALRADHPDVKVLFTSGYTELAAAGELAAERGPLLSKPYRKQDLGRAVRAAIDGASGAVGPEHQQG